MNSYAVSLKTFEGPLDLLVQLLQKKEVDPAEIEVRQITTPFYEMVGLEGDCFDLGADFILLASQVALLKSRFLLPSRNIEEGLLLDLEDDPKFDMIHHLIDYCRFKEAAQLFSEMEGKQGEHYARGLKVEEGKPFGLGEVSLDELGLLFQEILKKGITRVGTIEEEEFQIHDKILWLRATIRNQEKSLFLSLFQDARSKLELIVIFLSILELIKVGEIRVIKLESGIYVYGI